MSKPLDEIQALGRLPEGLRRELLDEFGKITRHFVRGDWGASELYGGRFCEVVYSVLKGYVEGSFPDAASKPANFQQRCRELEHAEKSKHPHAVRVGIPRLLIGLYDFRNNRDSGHVGGEVDANQMDATFVLQASQWVMAELVRLFHDTDTAVATSIVTALVERTLPLIWQVNGRRRILDSTMRLADKTLVLLYDSALSINDTDLAADLKQERLRDYRKILRRLDRDLMVEYHEESGSVFLSPKGEKEVEDRLLPAFLKG